MYIYKVVKNENFRVALANLEFCKQIILNYRSSNQILKTIFTRKAFEIQLHFFEILCEKNYFEVDLSKNAVQKMHPLTFKC